jgi:flavin-dependent dehydrogenase
VDNVMRVPYGPGWALTGDAAFCKDPSTGTGIEDSFRQSFLLAQALDAALDGADWETTLAGYHQRRDEELMASYRSTLSYTRTTDMPVDALAWLQAIAANAGLVRLLGHNLPAAIQAPGVFPRGLLASIEHGARRFQAAASKDGASNQAA